jgi:hypothetical protein
MSGESRSSAEAALKALTRVLLDRVGGLDAAAAVLNSGSTRGVRRSQLANYYNPHCNQFLPIDLLARLEEVVGEPVVTAELARRAGQVLSRPAGMPSPCMMQDLARLAAESADLHRVVAESLSDGQLCDEDLVRIEREATQMHAAAGDTLATVRALQAPISIVTVATRGKLPPWQAMRAAIRDGVRRMRPRS